jgi:hypothetical protein
VGGGVAQAKSPWNASIPSGLSVPKSPRIKLVDLNAALFLTDKGLERPDLLDHPTTSATAPPKERDLAQRLFDKAAPKKGDMTNGLASPLVASADVMKRMAQLAEVSLFDTSSTTLSQFWHFRTMSCFSFCVFVCALFRFCALT